MKTPNSEYDEIYERYDGSGFKFDYNNNRLSRSKPVLIDIVKGIDPSKRNHDDIPLFVKCGKCEEYMDFEAGPNNMLDGKWSCSVCGTHVRERTVYNQLEKENDEWENEYDDIYNEDFDDFC